MQGLTLPELLRLLNAARSVRDRDWLMILLAWWHGLRASEVISLQRDSIQDGHLILQRLKGSNKTAQPLVEHSEPLLNERAGLERFMFGMSNNQVLFPISRQHFWRIMQRHGKTAQIPARKLHPHALKHGIAMHLVHSISINELQQYLGHKSLSSTGAYLKVTDDEASSAVQRAIAKN